MRVWIVVGAVALVGCSSVLPLDKPPPSDAGGDVTVVEAGGDGPALESGTDPDAALPDTWPHFDGLTTCKTLWAAPVPIQVSDTANVPASAPSIAAIGNDFYVAFVEGGEVQIRRVSPFGATPLGATTKLSSAGTIGSAHQDPWVAAFDSSKLVVTWTEPTLVDATHCASDLIVQEVGVSGDGTLSVSNACSPSQPFSSNGYAATSVAVGDNGTYVVVARVEYQNTACDAHTKGVAQGFTSGQCGVLGGGYNQLVGTKYIAVGFVPTSAAPWNILRVHQASTDLYEVYHNTSANGSTWNTAAETKLDSPVERVRPALVADATDGLFMAYVKMNGTRPEVILRHEGAAFQIMTFATAATEGGNTEPALATDKETTAIVFTELDTGGKPHVIRAVPVSANNTVGLKIGVSGAAVSAAAEPRAPVVAAGSGGFGVAWVENVSGSSEVMFNWVGCRP